MVRSQDCQPPGFNPQRWLLAEQVTSPCFSFSICKMDTVIVSTPQGRHEEGLRTVPGME